jgi:hypothetical protein
MRSIIARVAKLAKAYVIGEQRDWQTATEGNEVGDLMMVGLQLVVPAFLRLQILPRFNDKGSVRSHLSAARYNLYSSGTILLRRTFVWNSDGDATMPAPTRCFRATHSTN